MAVITGSVLVDLLLALLIVAYFIYWFFTNNNDYWDKKGVPNVKKGFLLDALRGTKSQADGVTELYKKFPDEKYFGFFQVKQPALIIKDLDLINRVLVKDFVYFEDRGGPRNDSDPLSKNLFALRGQVWRALRYKLTPTFTTGKLKGMFEQVSKCGNNMVKKVKELIKESDDIETKSFLFEYTSEVISSCAFGLQFEPSSKDFAIFKSAVSKTFKPSVYAILKFIIVFLSPKLAEILKLRTFVGGGEGEYFLALIKATSKYRKDNNIKRNDYLQLLLNLKEQEENGQEISLPVWDATEEDAVVDQMRYTEKSDHLPISNIKFFSDETVCANSVIFLIAGSESTASTISFTLFELARNPAIQQTLQKEVDKVMAVQGEWSYQAIKEMTYLDQVVQEAQRLYPILPMLTRECTKPYKIPDSDLVIEKGTLVTIPVIALHKDPQYYPDPQQFKPERFEGNNFKPNSTYLPYGDGPRICIAMRFAVMEVKTAVAKIMAKYTLKLSPKTELPIKLHPRSFVPLAEGGTWLTFEKRQTV